MTVATDSRIRYQHDLLLILLKLQIILVSFGLISNIARLLVEPPLRGFIQIAIQIFVIVGSWGAIRLLKSSNYGLAAQAYLGLVVILAAINTTTSPGALILLGVMLLALASIIAGLLKPLVKVWQWAIINILSYIACLTLRNQIDDFHLDLERSELISLYVIPPLMIVLYAFLGQRIGQFIAANFGDQQTVAKKNAELYNTAIQEITERVLIETRLKEREQSAHELQDHLRTLHQMTLELAMLGSLDDIYRRGVEYGLTKFGFDRLGLFGIDETGKILLGTFGTDPDGKLRDERDYRTAISDDPAQFWEGIALTKNQVALWEDTELLDYAKGIGRGWHARAVLWDGTAMSGLLVVDNLIHHRPPRVYETELISLYSSTLAHAISRKQAELSLRQREQSSIEFQEYLKKLHEMTLELANLESLDDIYRRGVAFGLNELDLDRIALFRLDEDNDMLLGTYGTDTDGNLRDEQGFTMGLRDGSPPYFDEVLASNNFVMIVENIDLRDSRQVIGNGWHIRAVLLDGTAPIGILVADNFIHQRPPRPYEQELISTFSATLAHAISRKEAELILQQNEQSSRDFQKHLKMLHAMTLELATLETLDEIYKRGVEYGLTKLGLDRMAILRLDDTKEFVIGTYGTDPDGNLRAEHDFTAAVRDDSPPYYDEVLAQNDLVMIIEDIDLRDYQQAVGKGWHACAVFLDGPNPIGMLVADNLIHHRPPRPYERELIATFASTLSHAISRKESELSLRQREQASSELKEHLKSLHRLTLELSTFDNLDDIYRRGIDYGLTEFGFDRLALFRLDATGNRMLGTYGTDPDGKLRDERDFTSEIDAGPRPFWDEVVKGKDQVALWMDVDLVDYNDAVGTGWNAMAALWDGETVIGILALDNFVTGRPLRSYELELISLFSGTLAHLIRVQEAKNTLRQNEQSAREFQDHLKTLHRMTIELAQLETIDEMFKRGVEYGIEEFGIERLGLFLIDHDTEELVGMFGTGPDGKIRDERGFRTSIHGRAKQFLDEVVVDKDQVGIWENVELIDYDQVVGTGWNGMAALWSGDQTIGAVAFDNFITQRPLRPYEHDLMRLYTSVLSHLVTRHRAEESRLDYAMERERVKVLQHFLAAASHDLRTPLSVVQMNAHLLRSIDNEQQREHYLDIVDNQVERLKKLLEDMLSMSRLDSTNEFEYEWLDLVNLTRNILDQQGATATRKNQNVAFEPMVTLPPIYADRVQLGQAIRNILINALQYSPIGGDIAISIYQEAGHAVIAVRDSGVGISEEHLPHIFERFYRSDIARSTETGGSGLGLSIAQKIIDGHGGDITVTSEIGVGSTFKIILPLHKVPPEE